MLTYVLFDNAILREWIRNEVCSKLPFGINPPTPSYIRHAEHLAKVVDKVKKVYWQSYLGG
jgi:hypothetical protein